MISVGYPGEHRAATRCRDESLHWFVPVATIGTGPSLLVVPNSLPVNSMQELIALAKSKPGELNAGAAGAGSFQHLATELFRLQAGIDIVIVQYKGGGPALTDTIAGQVQMNVGSAIQNLPHVRSGKLRALGVGGHEAHRGAARRADLRRGRGCRARRRRTGGASSRPPARRPAALKRLEKRDERDPRFARRRRSASSSKAPRCCA